MHTYTHIHTYIQTYIGLHSELGSAQVRAYDDRAQRRSVGSPYKQELIALSSYALTCVALTSLLSGSASDRPCPDSTLPNAEAIVSKAPKGKGIGATGSKNWVWF